MACEILKWDTFHGSAVLGGGSRSVATLMAATSLVKSRRRSEIGFQAEAYFHPRR